MTRTAIVTVFLALLVLACGGSGSPSPDPDPGTAPLLAAGAKMLDPAPSAGWSAGLDLARLGVTGVDAFYDLTTPADEPFAFDVLCRRSGNAGAVRVSVAHVADDGTPPAGGPETLATAGLTASGPGRQGRSPWLDAIGDGFSRLTLSGRIDREQVIAVQASGDDREGTALVRLRLGPVSAINAAGAAGGDYPGVIEETTLYSSDAWTFGLPTIAVSGDRTSVVCYEGDRGNPDAWGRFEMRLQHEAATGIVTGGGSEETSPDSGNWRDHEIAALYNVLALAHGGDDQVTLKLSFDRGATFGQVERFQQGVGAWRPRLVQIAMALDYALALVYWRSNRDGSTDLVLVEGRPAPYPPGGSPEAFVFDPPAVVHHQTGDVTPALMSVAWSEGGDLVIGYAFTRFTTLPDRRWESLTQNRCAVRPFGEPLRDVLVEEDRIVGRDPSVALTGQGETLRIFYAYEAQGGVRLRVSDDAGLTFADPVEAAEPGAYMPTVLARPGQDLTVVDLLYLAFGAGGGMEIHLLHWPVFGPGAAPERYRLTTATVEGDIPPGPIPGVPPPETFDVAPPPGLRTTQVAFFGYDAVLDGDEIVLVYDEETWDAIYYFDAPGWGVSGEIPLGAGGAEDGSFVAAEPPPLAEGMTEEVPVPDPEHMHQLKLLRLR